MDRTKTIFLSSSLSELNYELSAEVNSATNEIFFRINDPSDDSGYYDMFIYLDRKTAIKFVKHLKREISYIESEDNNV